MKGMNNLNDAMEEFLVHLQAVINHMRPVVEKIIQILDGTIESYELNEMLHPRKKPRGSLRRKRKEGHNDRDR